MTYRDLVGFEKLLGDWHPNSDAYPYHNIVQLEPDSDNYVIELAVAGFRESDLSIEVKDHVLTVTGKSDVTPDEGVRYLHKGISTRKFSRSFRLHEYIEVTGASYENGILSIDLVKVVPERERARSIPIGSPSESQLLNG